jgi:hypothetical protein
MTEKPKAYLVRQAGETIFDSSFVIFLPDVQCISVTGSVYELAADIRRKSESYSLCHEGFTPKSIDITDPDRYRLLDQDEIARVRESLAIRDAALASQLFGDPPEKDPGAGTSVPSR